jgi:uncharacterized protein HemY
MLSEFACLLANAPDPKVRDPERAVELAEKAVAGDPRNASFRASLGTARYRAGSWEKAIADLELAANARKPSDPAKANDWFFLAMAHWQLGETGKARSWYDKAIGWIDKNAPQSEDLKRFRAEAQGLLGIPTVDPAKHAPATKD